MQEFFSNAIEFSALKYTFWNKNPKLSMGT